MAEVLERMPFGVWLGGRTLSRRIQVQDNAQPWQLDALADAGIIERRTAPRGTIQYRRHVAEGA